jgi:type VI secretion system protein ImpF
MARQDIERPVQQSLLDRLIDKEPHSKVEPAPTRSESVKAFKVSVRRDIEWLLNTRSTPRGDPEGFEESPNSVLHFGLPDLTSLNDSSEDRMRLMRMVQSAITDYEPRLQNVVVSESESREGGGRQVRFLIQATLRMDPSPELVYFDTVLDLASREYQVKGD